MTAGKDAVVAAHAPIDFNAREIQPVTLDGPPALMERDWMSPYVWQDSNGRLGIMVRAVPKPDAAKSDTGVIWAGWSDDGTMFTMLPEPAIVPGPNEIQTGGVEDPTVLQRKDGSYVVYYTGVTADMAHGELFYAVGPSIDRLTKTGVALASSKSEGNTKEATVMRTVDGEWRLFYEYAEDNASRIGLALGPDVAGPWDEQPTPLRPRDDSWDNWHLSTGPILTDHPEWPVMFYNGATADARWRIGWAVFDRGCTRIVDRGIEPLIVPPPATDRTDTDIAFAASAVVQDGQIWLYYSLEDRKLARARIRRS